MANRRIIVVNENITKLAERYLGGKGYLVIRFPKGTEDPTILDYVREHNTLLITGDIGLYNKAVRAGFEVLYVSEAMRKKPMFIKYLISQGL